MKDMALTESQLKYRTFMNMALGAFAGVLIAAPMNQLVLIVIFSVAGGMAGYRRRESTGFFYFAAACTLILSSIYLYSLLQNPQTARPPSAVSQ